MHSNDDDLPISRVASVSDKHDIIFGEPVIIYEAQIGVKNRVHIFVSEFDGERARVILYLSNNNAKLRTSTHSES